MLRPEKDPSHLPRVPGRLKQMPVRQVVCRRLFPSTPPFPFCQVCSMEPSLSICLCMKPEWQCGAHQHSASPVDRTTARRLQECISRDQEGNSICWDYYQRWNVQTAGILAKSGCSRPAPGLMGYIDEIGLYFFINNFCLLTFPNRNANLMVGWRKIQESWVKLCSNFYFFKSLQDFSF